MCSICVRRGSKGIKNKNLKPFTNKKSLFDITLNHALKTNEISKIVISTDYKQIIQNKLYNKNKKIYLHSRNEKLCDDNIAKIDVIGDALIYAEKNFNCKFDYILDLDVTSPLRKIEDINNSIKFFKKKKNLNNLMTICESKKSPMYNMVRIVNSKIQFIDQNKFYNSRQKVPKMYDVNASIYLWSRKAILNKKLKIINSKTGYYIMPRERSIDIDDNLDFKIAKYLFHEK